MPLYEYICEKCKKVITELMKFSDPAPKCCEQEMKREFPKTSPPILKGTGWFTSDYGGKKPK